ncbi:MAG: YfbK domain-containing protein [Flammeovirgaceae bacterium]
MRSVIKTFLFLLLTISVVKAQKIFEGTVYANSAQVPLAGVSVTVKGGVGAAITDKDGKFSLTSYQKAPILIFNYKGLAVQERTYKKKKVAEVMTIAKKYLGVTHEKLKTAEEEEFVGNDNVFFFSQISELAIKEDVFYSESKKQTYREIRALSLVIPGEMLPTGLSKYLITFDFKDVERVLNASDQAKWVNPFNPLQKSDYATALKQHWFKSEIFLYRNPKNDRTDELFDDKQWAKFRSLYQAQGDLFKDVREKWQNLEASQIAAKPKKIKLPKKVTDLTTLWLRVDLRDSLNQSFLSYEREISKLLIEAYKRGELVGYIGDKLEERMSISEFMERMKIPYVDEGEDSFDMGFGGSDEDDGWGGGDDDANGGGFRVAIPIESSNEEYDAITENRFLFAKDEPLSTFSIDVDRASYSNMRRFLNAKQFPPTDAIRIEELINYFDYDYPKPTGNQPFSISTEVASCPWNEKNQVVQIGLQGKEVKTADLPAMNLVFLLDVSGSMSAKNKLPLLKESLKLLMEQLRPKDRVAIVVYAGAAGMVLPSTFAAEKDSIIAAFDKLQAGGSTAGGEGILLAYQIARQHFIENGNNRIILATDGDFNVGVSDKEELEQLIVDQRNSGVFLTVLGFGMGNLKDAKMETLADKGNGNYAYIDKFKEAKKVLVQEFAGTLYAIAKDVKIQVDFNPAQVAAYRLIGYENRKLENKDFEDDKKDAGELGAGHTVTALYEIVPTRNGLSVSKKSTRNATVNSSTNLFTVKLRYKAPDGEQSQLIKHAVNQQAIRSNPSVNLQFSCNVAQFGMLLRESPFKGSTSYEALIKSIGASLGTDSEGYRKEFEELVKKGLGLWQLP